MDPHLTWQLRIDQAETFRFWIACGATLVLAAGLALRIAGHPGRLRHTRTALLVCLALGTLFAWWHPYRGSLRAWLHVGDAYHYYLGAKYFDELGYTRLYDCTIVADAEAGYRDRLEKSFYRDLETNRIESSLGALADPRSCKRHFEPRRWQAFSTDVAWFRAKLDFPAWKRLRSDHGYNAPPSWTAQGRPLASASPAGRAQFFFLTSLDPLLLAAMFGAVAWGFGVPAACVAFVFWGTNQPASWTWVGGGILRYDWLAAAVGSLCCLRRGKPVAAGLLLAWATGLRIFPIAIGVGLGFAELGRMIRARSLRPAPDAFRFGTALATGLLGVVVVSSALVGPTSWIDFAKNSRLHLASDTVNRTGLRPLLAYRPQEQLAHTLKPRARDPYASWRRLRAATLEERRVLHVAIVLAACALLGTAASRQPHWIGGALGVGFVPILTELGSYYFSVLVVFALLWTVREAVGVALLAFAAASWTIGSWQQAPDVLTMRTSLGIVLLVIFTALAFLRPEAAPWGAPSSPDAEQAP